MNYLVEQGAKMDSKNQRGQTPLAIALSRIDRSKRQLRPDVVAALKVLDNGATQLPAQPAPAATTAADSGASTPSSTDTPAGGAPAPRPNATP